MCWDYLQSSFLSYLEYLKCLYHSLIYSHLSYCRVSWGSTYPTKFNCLLLLQKRVLRITTQSGWRDHSRPLFTRLGILNVFQITKLQMGELVYKLQNLNQNNLLPDIYDSYFTNIGEANRYCTRSR